jgi:transcription elongation factor GreA
MKQEVNMSNSYYVTQEGLKKLKKELEKLTSVDRPAISQQIADAREKGDLSENAEYDAAKEAQGMLEMKINRIEDHIANARIIDESKIDTESVQLMNRVKIRNKANNSSMQYMIVSESEADLREGKISVSTPIARGLIGKKVGDIVKVKIPSGIVEYEVIEISL